MICLDRRAIDVLGENIVAASLKPTVHISCTVVASSKTNFNFTALPNPYNGFDRVSNFPVTVSLNNSCWTDDNKRMLCHENAAWFSLNFSFLQVSLHSLTFREVIVNLLHSLPQFPFKRITPGIGQEARH